MHVLLLALNYAPDKLGNAPINTGLAEGLVRLGRRVTVVCAQPHHETGRRTGPGGFTDTLEGGVRVLRVPILAGGTSAAGKASTYASFTALAAARAALVRGVDVVLTPSPPLTLGLVDALLSRLRRVPFVYWVQDLFPEAAVRLGVVQSRPAIAALERVERLVYAEAAHVSVICEAFARHLLAHRVPRHKISVIPNFADTTHLAPAPSRVNPFRAHLPKDAFVIQFSGRMGRSQALHTVLAAWQLVRAARPAARLMMVGDGPTQAQVRAALAGDPRATVLPTQARAALPELLAAADVGLTPLQAGLAGTSLPSKLLSLMAAGRPVVAGVDAGSDAATLVRAARCGVVVPPEDVGALAQALLMLHDDPQGAAAMGERGRAHAVGHYSAEVVVPRYDAMLQRVADEGRR